VNVYLHAVLTSAADGGEWSASRPGRFNPGERTPDYNWIGGWEITSGYKIFVGKLDEKRPPGKRRFKWEDNIKMDLRDTECESVDWIDMTQEMSQWLTVVTTVNEISDPVKGRVFLDHANECSASQKGLYSMEFVCSFSTTTPSFVAPSYLLLLVLIFVVSSVFCNFK